MLEEAKRRDHRKIGKDLDLFSIDETIGAGLVLWHPKGARIRHVIETFWREEHFARRLRARQLAAHRARRAVEDLRPPGFYKENMFSGMDVDGQQYIAQADELPVPLHDVTSTGCAAIASYRTAGPSSARCIATSVRACCTASCACAASRRTTRTCSCTREQLPGELERVVNFVPLRLADVRVHRVQAVSRDPAEGLRRQIAEMWRIAEAALMDVLKASGLPVRARSGRRRVLRPEDRPQAQGRDRPRVAVLDRSRSTSTCRSGSICSTSARTARNIGR